MMKNTTPFIKHNIVSFNLNMLTNINTDYGIKIMTQHSKLDILQDATSPTTQHKTQTRYLTSTLNTKMLCERTLDTLNRIMMKTKVH